VRHPHLPAMGMGIFDKCNPSKKAVHFSHSYTIAFVTFLYNG
jgi:hypothetical protein